ncbi:MAG: sigma-54 dependent transcriptional regulator [Pseudomonadota bacterium]
MTSANPAGIDIAETTGSILIIEDEALFAKAVERRMGREGHRCAVAPSLNDARARLAEARPDLVILDIRLPDGSGLDFLRVITDRDEAPPVIVMTAYGEVDDAVTAMKFGAADYVKKPVDLDELALNVNKVLANNEVSERLEHSLAREEGQSDSPEMLGDSAAMTEIRSQIERIGKLTEATSGDSPTVLIMGETGTGKDVAARALHRASARRDRPFVHVDCAALPKDLIEAELFGHVKGAFTSAQSDRTGLIEAAEDGVIFLDEVGELPADLQAKLLAVLERRMLRRIGSSQERPTKAWFVAATNRDLEAMIAAGDFRSDLYFRLRVISFSLPPLRERGSDVQLLAQAFVSELGRRYGIEHPSIEAGAMVKLANYHWPGNIRELKHVMERALLMAADGIVSADALMLSAATQESPPPEFELDGLTLEDAERLLIERALAVTDGNVSETARRLGTTRMTIRYRMQKYGLE